MSATLGKRVRDENVVEVSFAKKQRITPTVIPFSTVDLNAQSAAHAVFEKKPVDVAMKDADGKENQERVDDIEEEDEVVGLYEDDLNAPLVDEEADDFGLQSEETNFDVNDGAEPQEALQLAKELGLVSSEEALAKMGNSAKKTDGVISAYSALIDRDQQTKSVYDELTKEIEETENKVRAGIESIFQHHAAGSKVKLTKDSVDYLRNVFEKYIKIIADAALVHAQHRQRGVVLLHNILEAFKLLGVTMYWPSEVDMPEEDDSEDEEDAAEEAADENNVEDGDESESEDEEDALNKTNDEAENEEEAKESRFKIDSVAFRRIADAVVEPQEDEEEVDDENDEEDAGDDEEEDENEWAIQENALDAMQASAEEFTSQLVESALKMAQLYAREEITPADLKFVLTLWQNTPGGSDIMKRIRI
jgi:histone H3/H4